MTDSAPQRFRTRTLCVSNDVYQACEALAVHADMQTADEYADITLAKLFADMGLDPMWIRSRRSKYRDALREDIEAKLKQPKQEEDQLP